MSAANRGEAGKLARIDDLLSEAVSRAEGPDRLRLIETLVIVRSLRPSESTGEALDLALDILRNGLPDVEGESERAQRLARMVVAGEPTRRSTGEAERIAEWIKTRLLAHETMSTEDEWRPNLERAAVLLRGTQEPGERAKCPPHGPWLHSIETNAVQCQSCGCWFDPDEVARLSAAPTETEVDDG